MTKKSRYQTPDETGAILKPWANRTRVVLVYPNTYSVGMSNLGFQTVYARLNDLKNVVCERAFLPEPHTNSRRLVSVESGHPLADFDIIAFSISFESDFIHILSILDRAGIPLKSAERKPQHPLVLAGGVACFLNPEPIAAFVDMFLLGEAEALISDVFAAYEPAFDKFEQIEELARQIPGVYAPGFYDVIYNPDETIAEFCPNRDVPERVHRVFIKDISNLPTCSTLLTSDTSFDSTWLVETGRGCPHGCRFCSAGYIYRPPRFRPIDLLKTCIDEGLSRTDRIGLMGAAVSDLPGLSSLCAIYSERDARISFSSFRADALTPELLATLKQSRVKTATIAPDGGSERMRRVINKGITEADILSGAETLVASDIPNLKLYFMVGLPSETDADVAAITDLCKAVKARFLASSRKKGRIGEISVSLNPFVPKPMTPFQWAAMDTVRLLKAKIKRIREQLRRIPNLRLQSEHPGHSHIQAIMSRGDRRVAALLTAVHRNNGNWPSALKHTKLNTDTFVHRERGADEVFPWDFIEHGVTRAFLRREYERAMDGKTSPPCPMTDACRLCGACGNETLDFPEKKCE